MDITDESYVLQDSAIEPLTQDIDEKNIVKSSHNVHRKAELDAQQALNETGFGKFNYKIIIVSGMMCMNVAFAITSVGFLLPSAACDFNMNTSDKGRLSASPIFGMLLGSCIWGCIADTKGRRTALLNCLFLQAIFECSASVVSNYWGFIVFKFLSGFALSGQMAVLYTYVGEFQPANHREKALSFMEIPWVLGTILAPIIAWITIPLDINVTISAFSFKSWNLYAAMCSVPAFVVGFILLKLPETPKYLAETARYAELRNVLISMYCENTGNTTDEFIAHLDNTGITFFTDRSNNPTSKDADKNKSLLGGFRQFFVTLYKQTITLLKPPYLGRTTITCLGSYCIFASLYTLMLWFPELFHRFGEFEIQHPGERASVCIVSQSISLRDYKNETISDSSLPINQIKTDDITTETTCDRKIGTQVYVYTLILALSCIPVAVIFSVCASRLGFRFYLVFNSFGCCAVTIGLLFVTTSTQNLILSCIYEALMSICVTVIFCISVELFPTNLRVTGSALASLFGRIGALVGNTMFGYLIDDHCLVLISIVAVELFLSGVLGFFITSDNDGESKERDEKCYEVPTTGLTDYGSAKYSSSVHNSALHTRVYTHQLQRLARVDKEKLFRETVHAYTFSLSAETKVNLKKKKQFVVTKSSMKIGNDDLSKNVSIAESVAENAVNQTGFGKFNYKIMTVCGLIYFNYGFGIGSLGIVIPSAACDFEMTTIDKSRLSVAAALGMLCGAYWWGCTADIKGRKFTLIAALLLHGGFDGISAIVSNYWVFVVTKFFSGLGMSGELALVFAYLGEFQPSHVRDRILTWMELAWAIGFTVVPAIAWGIIPLNFGYKTTYFFFNSWNLFMLLCSIPSILIAIQLFYLPETPKYLAESGQYAELLNVLEKMFSDNTGASSGEYAIKISKMGDSTLDELINLARTTDTKRKNRKTVGDKMSSFLNQTVMIFKPPYLITTLIIGTVMICLMSSYFTMVMWLPEVFNRFATFEGMYPGEAANICSVADRLRRNVTNILASGLDSENDIVACDIGIKTEVYLHSIILGITSVPTAIWFPLFVERLGYIFHLVVGSFICAAVTCGLFFVTTSIENLILSCIFEAIASICITAVLCMLVELYPTNLRVMAAAFTTFIGRVGCFAGNGLFGYLIDDYCIPLISIIAGQFFLSGVLCIFIPLKSKRQSVDRSETTKL